MTTWKKLITEQMREYSDSWENVESFAIPFGASLNEEFDDGYGSVDGCPFCVWTETRVYFPWCYDGAEGVGSVSRMPDGKPANHFGGG